MVRSNSYCFNPYLFFISNIYYFVSKLLCEINTSQQQKIWSKIDFFLSKLGELRPCDLQCFKWSNCVQTNYLFKMSYFTVSNTQIIFKQITFLRYPNIRITYRSHQNRNSVKIQDTYSNRFNSRQNGKHRRSRPREGRVGDVWPPGSKLPGTFKQSTWQQSTTKYNQGKDNQVQLGTIKYKTPNTTK